MDIRILKRAEEHLNSCKAKSEEMSSAKEFTAAARLWSEFLVDHQRWFTRMQQALEKGPSSAWFGALKGRRKSDAVLAYLHQARHADEHGLERIAEGDPGGIGIGGGGGWTYIEKLTVLNGLISVEGSQSDGPLKITITAPHLKLNQVENRGQKYDPPRDEKGEPHTAISAALSCVEIMTSASAEAFERFGPNRT